MNRRVGLVVMLLVAAVTTARVSRAASVDDGGAGASAPARSDSTNPGGGRVVLSGKAEDGDRYFFNLLTRRSRYGTGFFPEHFRQTSLDREHELRLDYFQGGHTGRHEQEIEGEIEWAIKDLTLTVEAEWESEHEIDEETGGWKRDEGWQTVKFKAHHPLYQYVSADDSFDYTLVGKVSVGVPLSGSLRHDSYEIYPLLGQLLRLGGHFTTQTWTGVNFVTGGDERGTRELRYGALFGWNLSRTEVAIPGVQALTPLLELDGQSSLSGEEHVHRLFGVAGARFDLTPIGPLQPRFGLGYLFPIDTGARRELSWGVQSSLIFEF